MLFFVAFHTVKNDQTERVESTTLKEDESSKDSKDKSRPEDQIDQDAKVDEMKNLSLNEADSSGSNVNTRYVCVKHGDSQVSVFRETAV